MNAEPNAEIEQLRATLKTSPQDYDARLKLARLLYASSDLSGAVAETRIADKYDPLLREFQASQQATQARQFGRAQQIARQMMASIPDHPRALFALAQVAQAYGDHQERRRLLEQGLTRSPANLILRMAAFSAYESSGEIERAIQTAQHIAELEENFDTVSTLTGILFRYGQNEEALTNCDRTVPFCAGDRMKLSEVHLVRAQIYRILGAREKSIASFRACLADNPDNAAAWWGLADMKTFEFSADDRAMLKRLLQRPGLHPDQKCQAAFALAKASESEADWDHTINLYHTANAMQANRRFDRAKFTSAINRVVANLNRETLATQARERPRGPTPIFILGLPRSGSTLVEQILASHSQIEGTIEQPILPNTKMKAHALCVKKYGGDYLDRLGEVSRDELQQIGQSYLDDGALFRGGGRAFFTDKLPFNFEHVGLIHKILPNAIIIDTRRNPLDCGLSLYKQYFSQGSDFSYSLADIGAYFNGYLALMDHWNAMLPGKLLTVQHETLVRDPEAGIRRILAHIGVPFEPACLDFHLTDRAVRTASSEQVRQPINTKGIGTWRKVERHLEPLKTALGAETLARFEGQYDP